MEGTGTARRAAIATLVVISIVVAALALWQLKLLIALLFIGFVIASAFVTWVTSGHTLSDYRKVVTPELTGPITVLRTWAFIFCFFSIGLTTRLKSLSATGVKPFVAFTAGVLVNVAVGYLLSVHVFGHYWAGLGQ